MRNRCSFFSEGNDLPYSLCMMRLTCFLLRCIFPATSSSLTSAVGESKDSISVSRHARSVGASSLSVRASEVAETPSRSAIKNRVSAARTVSTAHAPCPAVWASTAVKNKLSACEVRGMAVTRSVGREENRSNVPARSFPIKTERTYPLSP